MGAKERIESSIDIQPCCLSTGENGNIAFYEPRILGVFVIDPLPHSPDNLANSIITSFSNTLSKGDSQRVFPNNIGVLLKTLWIRAGVDISLNFPRMSQSGMIGASVALACISKRTNELIIAWTGDTKVGVVENGKPKILTTDDVYSPIPLDGMSGVKFSRLLQLNAFPGAKPYIHLLTGHGTEPNIIVHKLSENTKQVRVFSDSLTEEVLETDWSNNSLSDFNPNAPGAIGVLNLSYTV